MWGAASAVPVRIAACALGFRLVSAVLALLANVTFPASQPSQVTLFGQPSPFWDAFVRFDSGWYHQIARNGYGFVVAQPRLRIPSRKTVS